MNYANQVQPIPEILSGKEVDFKGDGIDSAIISRVFEIVGPIILYHKDIEAVANYIYLILHEYRGNASIAGKSVDASDSLDRIENKLLHSLQLKDTGETEMAKEMSVSEARKAWGMSEKKVYEICRELKIKKREGKYCIPKDMKRPYYPDARSILSKDRLRVYIHVLNAITDQRMIIPVLIGTDNQHIKTAVRELYESKAIVLLEGAENDYDYQHYMIGMQYSNWTMNNIKTKLSIVSDILKSGNEVEKFLKNEKDKQN